MNREDNSMILSDAEFDRRTAGKRTQIRSADFDGWLFKYVAAYESGGDEMTVEVNEVYHCSPSAAVFARAGIQTSDLYVDLVDTILKFEVESLYDLLEKNDEAKGEDVI